jgi:hypothetical protein
MFLFCHSIFFVFLDVCVSCLCVLGIITLFQSLFWSLSLHTYRVCNFVERCVFLLLLCCCCSFYRSDFTNYFFPRHGVIHLLLFLVAFHVCYFISWYVLYSYFLILYLLLQCVLFFVVSLFSCIVDVTVAISTLLCEQRRDSEMPIVTFLS